MFTAKPYTSAIPGLTSSVIPGLTGNLFVNEMADQVGHDGLVIPCLTSSVIPGLTSSVIPGLTGNLCHGHARQCHGSQQNSQCYFQRSLFRFKKFLRRAFECPPHLTGYFMG